MDGSSRKLKVKKNELKDEVTVQSCEILFERLFEGYGKDKTRANNKQIDDDDDLDDAAKGAKSHSLRQPHRDGQDVDARNESGPSHGKLTKEQKVVQRGANKRGASQSWIFVGRLQMIQYYVSSVWGMRVFVFLYCKIFLSGVGSPMKFSCILRQKRKIPEPSQLSDSPPFAPDPATLARY